MQSDDISTRVCPDTRDLGKAMCIVTGASKGFGRSVAKAISSCLKPRSVIILVARSGDKLRELQTDLEASDAGRAELVIRCVAADLGIQEGVENVLKATKETASPDIDHLLLINNAGSLGDVSRYARSFTDMAEVNSYLSLNVSSALSLTASLLQAFPQRPGLRRCVVNVSSLCALQPFRSWVLYCSGKSAREMLFRVLAEEEPDIRVLNYAPGPLDTDMQAEARASSADDSLRLSFSTMHSQGQLVSCDHSSRKLLKVLLEDDYASGAHLDFYEL